MKKLPALLLALALVFCLCACGSSSQSSLATSENAADYSSASVSMEDYAAPASASGEDYGLSGAAGSGSEELPADDPQKIIYSAEVNVETTSFDDSLELLSDLVDEYEGWVESSSINGANYNDTSSNYRRNRSASYTLRIPSQSFSTLMNRLTALGNVPYSHTYTENVSAQYYDVQARLTAYTTQEESLLAMMEQADNVTDLIAIEEKLTLVRYQIESLQSSLNNWDRQVSYSTIYLYIDEVGAYTPQTQEQTSFGQELWLALKGGFSSALVFLKDLLIFLVSILPLLIVVALLSPLYIPALKKRRAKRKAKKQGNTDVPPAKDEFSDLK